MYVCMQLIIVSFLHSKSTAFVLRQFHKILQGKILEAQGREQKLNDEVRQYRDKLKATEVL